MDYFAVRCILSLSFSFWKYKCVPVRWIGISMVCCCASITPLHISIHGMSRSQCNTIVFNSICFSRCFPFVASAISWLNEIDSYCKCLHFDETIGTISLIAASWAHSNEHSTIGMSSFYFHLLRFQIFSEFYFFANCVHTKSKEKNIAKYFCVVAVSIAYVTQNEIDDKDSNPVGRRMARVKNGIPIIFHLNYF